jgi:hypothetical protein
MQREVVVGFIDRATKQVYSDSTYTLHRFQVGRCDVCIFVLRDEPRVFVGGGEFGFDSLAREADITEVEALAERFGLVELREAAARMRSSSVSRAAEQSATADRPRD